VRQPAAISDIRFTKQDFDHEAHFSLAISNASAARVPQAHDLAAVACVEETPL
jgi:hypothetical protein